MRCLRGEDIPGQGGFCAQNINEIDTKLLLDKNTVS